MIEGKRRKSCWEPTAALHAKVSLLSRFVIAGMERKLSVTEIFDIKLSGFADLL